MFEFMTLKRTIGPIGILFSGIGSIIGSGWLFGSFYAAKLAGPAAILSWIIGGLIMMFIAMTFAELATMLPVPGGVARFSHFSHGSLVSFTMSWCGWLSSVAIAPIETMALLQYSSNYFPWMTEDVGQTHILTAAGIGIAAVLLLILCILNYFGIKWISRLNTTIVSFKIAVPLLTIIVLMMTDFNVNNFTVQGFVPYGLKGILTALPSAGVIFSFLGYNAAVQLAGEAKNPKKMIPLAIIGALCITIVLYAFIQISFLGAVHLAPGMSWEHLDFAKDNGPFVGLALSLGLTWLVVILYADAIISPFGTALIYTSSSGRINLAMSQNGYMPKLISKLTKRGVPFNAIILNYIVGLILFLPFPGWQVMMQFLVSVFVFSYAVGPVALIALRKALPDQERPFKVPFAHFYSLFAFFLCNLLVFWTGWKVVWRILVAIAIGYILLFFYRKTIKTIEFFLPNAWWLIPYLIGLGVLALLGSFGGGLGIMPFGWDFLFIALFTIVIFYLAKQMALCGKRVQELLAGVVDVSHFETEAFKE